MRSQHKMTAGLLGILLVLISPASLANLLSKDGAVQSEYMETQRNSEVYARIGEHVIPVGEVKRGQLIQVFPTQTEYYAFKFGHGTGFIDKNDVRGLKKTRKLQDHLSELNKPSTNQNVITQKAINVYTDADNGSEVFGRLEENLRYPLIGKLQDRQNNTWYEINIGERLAYVSG